MSHFIHIEENPAALRQPLHHSFSSPFLPRCANLPIFQMCYFHQLKGFFRSGSLAAGKAVQFALSRWESAFSIRLRRKLPAKLHAIFITFREADCKGKKCSRGVAIAFCFAFNFSTYNIAVYLLKWKNSASHLASFKSAKGEILKKRIFWEPFSFIIWNTCWLCLFFKYLH